MTDTTPLTDGQLTAIRAQHERTTHPGWRSSTPVGKLLAELDRLRAELATAKAAGYRQAADNATEQVQLHGADADAQMLLVFLQRGATLREQFAAAHPLPTFECEVCSKPITAYPCVLCEHEPLED